MTSLKKRWNRRELLQQSVAGGVLAGLTIVPRHALGGAGYTAPSEKLNIAGIGVGNRGWTVIRQMEAHNIVALCDVDAKYLGKAAERYPNARKYKDFRKLIDWEESNIDAVTVCSTDHTHAPASMAALRAGRHEHIPKDKFADFQRPPRTIPESPGHADEWLAACKNGTPTGAHFGYSGPLTETVLLGTVAYRTGQKLERDTEDLKVTNCPEANQYLRREYRKGWTL
jgi:hypothetical protein